VGIKELASGFSFGRDNEPVLRTYLETFYRVINGYCLGGGCSWALCVYQDWPPKARNSGQPEVNMDFIPRWGGHGENTPFFCLGRSAAEMLLNRQPVNAGKLYRIVWSDRVVLMSKLK